MRSLFYDIHRTVMNTVERAGYSVSRILSIPGISRSWYYSQLSLSPILEAVSEKINIRIKRQRCLFHIEKDLSNRIKDSHREKDQSHKHL